MKKMFMKGQGLPYDFLARQGLEEDPDGPYEVVFVDSLGMPVFIRASKINERPKPPPEPVERPPHVPREMSCKEIPRECSLTDEQLERLGFKLKPVAESKDELFREAELPEGWKRMDTDHYMYSDLVDEKGRKRASFMYKGTAWDRDASLTFIHRYKFEKDWKVKDRIVYQLIDAGEVLFTCEAPELEKSEDEDWKTFYDREEAVKKELHAECKAYGDEIGLHWSANYDTPEGFETWLKCWEQEL